MYVAQGIPWGFTATTIPAYLSAGRLDPALVGTTLAMTTLPYTFKWAWGPIIDAFTLPRFGRRRPWIIFAQLMMALTIGTMIALPDLAESVQTLAWIILIHTVFNALQDVAVDALAVDLLAEAERGRANGLMYASKYVGGFIGGFCIATAIEYIGMRTALVLQVGTLLAIMIVPLVVRERPPAADTEARPPVGDVVRGLAEAFSVRSALVCAVLMLCIHFATGVLSANAFSLYTGPLGWSAASYTRLTGGYVLLAGFVGSIAGGFLADVVGRRAMIAIASIAMAAGWLAFGLAKPWWNELAVIYPLAIYESATLSIMTVSLFAICMDLSWPKVAASQFAAYMALSNFSTTLGFLVAGPAKSILDYDQLYLVAAGVQLAVTALLLAIDPTETRRTLPRPPGARVNPIGVLGLVALLAFLVAMTIYKTITTLS